MDSAVLGSSEQQDLALLPVADALARILEGVTPLETEMAPLPKAAGRVLAETLSARRTQPAFAASSMDGYAFRSGDATRGARLRLVGESAAGHGLGRAIAAGEAVRIFTGAPLPEGADTVLPQEVADVADGILTIADPVEAGRYVRPAGIDFADGATLLAAGTTLGPRELALAASANHADLPVRRRPHVGVLSIGDELVLPGGELGPDQTIAANAFAIVALANAAGAECRDLGIVPDKAEAVEQAARAAEADVFVTIGGASVGDHDVAKSGLAAAGMELGFWRIAMRPGKPLVFGRMGSAKVLGLPGNPVSAYVCALLFLRPLIARLLGRSDGTTTEPAFLGTDMPANGERAAYMRARLTQRADGATEALPLPDQDSSLLSVLSEADGLLIRPAGAAPSKAGSPCDIIRFVEGVT